MAELKFYVYAYLRDKDSDTAKAGTPYYIGKGTGKRYIDKHGKTPVPKNRNNIVFLEKNLTDLGAIALERRYIKWYGRKDICTGILLNLTNGGDGHSGFKRTQEAIEKLAKFNTGKKHSEETRKKISEANSGSKNGMFGKKQSEEHIRKNKESNTGKHLHDYWIGRKQSAEANFKRSIAMKGRPHLGSTLKGIAQSKLTCPHCGKEGGHSNMKRWHFQNCKMLRKD